MKAFNLVNAKTVAEAISRLTDYQGKAMVKGGGTDLLCTLKAQFLPSYPKAVINLTTIPDLDYIKDDAGGLRIGALAKLEDIAESATVREKYSVFTQAARAVGNPILRSMGTLGGNLCQDVRCWYYRYPHQMGGRVFCYLKGGKSCHALTGENQHHSIFGACRVDSPPCSSACPAAADTPSYLSQIRDGDLSGAAKILLKTNPIPSITGRVCPHPCEQECNRDKFDEPVSIRDIERFVGDYILQNAKEIIKLPKTATGRRVAIIGSGPAGLSAAYYLRMSGHRITVFDRMEEAGGMLAYAIPAYRLPKDIVRRVIRTMENAGIEFKLKVDIGQDITLGDLRKDFDGVFLANGAWSQPAIGLQGEELTKSGLEFLTSVNLGAREVPGRKILVIGGGNVAVDVGITALRLGAQAGITALRLGAQEVTLACLESREEMPALPLEIEQAVEEGVKLMPSWGPYRVLESEGKIKGIELVRCTSVFDQDGRFAPTLDKNVKTTVEADQVIMAVGQRADLSFIGDEKQLKVNQGLIVADRENQRTSIPGIFAGGEITSGPSTVIAAVAAGRRAAAAINLYLKEGGALAEEKDEKKMASLLRFNPEYLTRTSSVRVPSLPISQRSIAVEDTPGLGLSEVERETNRCFNCGCLAVNSSDTAIALTALDATIVTNKRSIPMGDFYRAVGNVLAHDEIVTEVQVPPPKADTKQTFLKFATRKTTDFAIVSVASVITLSGGNVSDARIVLGGVAPVPYRATAAEKATKGKAINETLAEMAGAAALKEVVPLTNNKHKIQIAKTLVKRAMLA